jgi:Flp pilus assembly protein TadG
MAFVVSLLCVLLFGIIEFGYLMSFRGSMAQSASEGAREAATAPRVGSTTDTVSTNATVTACMHAGNGFDDNLACTRAVAATAQAVAGFDKTCGAGGLTCTYTIHDCNGASDTTATPDCMTVALSFDNDANPLLPEVPLISAAVPDTLSAESVVQLNG